MPRTARPIRQLLRQEAGYGGTVNVTPQIIHPKFLMLSSLSSTARFPRQKRNSDVNQSVTNARVEGMWRFKS